VPIASFCVAQGARAIIVPGDAMFYNRRDRLVWLAARYALPAIYAQREFVDNGGLMSYGAKSCRSISNSGRLCRAHSERRKACRSRGSAGHQIGIRYQPQDSQDARALTSRIVLGASRRGNRIGFAMSQSGPSRHFVATPDAGRFRTEADMNRQARPAALVANDPFLPSLG
jgi:hypothetical protein